MPRSASIVVCGVCVAAWWLAACEPSQHARLSRALVGRGKVGVLGGKDLLALGRDGAEVIDASTVPVVYGALIGDDVAALPRAIEAAGLAGVLVDARRDALRGAAGAVARRIARYEQVSGMRGAYLSPLAAFYVPDPARAWIPDLGAAMAVVARRLLAGEAPPRIASFPQSLRGVDPVEVMVLVRSGERARLWRSARGSSFARALVTAAEVARQRWIEREQAMGGPIGALLAQLDVEVLLLGDDGEIGDRDPGFIDRVVHPRHGVAFDHKGAWRYLLPEATRAAGSPRASYGELFHEEGLPADSFDSPELRLYRMAVTTLGVSEGSPRTPAGLTDAVSRPATPQEVLGR